MSDQTNAWTRFGIERGDSGGVPGEFRAALATNGEASDGHILSIGGMRVPDSMPMLFRHDSTLEIPALGRIVEPSKSREGSGEEILRVTGRFDLEGDANDPLLAIRRGFASLVQQGTLDAMSVRWDPVVGKFVPRSSLPEDHYAFAARTTDGPAAFGMFFEESTAREGSIVAIGADPGALMGRASESKSAFEEAYWTVLAGRMGRGEATEEIPKEQRTTFEAMTKVLVDTIRTETREAFSMQREDVSDLGESRSGEEAEAKAEPNEASREVPVETTETNEPEIRKLDSAGLRGLIRETADESVSRRIGHALGRITR